MPPLSWLALTDAASMEAPEQLAGTASTGVLVSMTTMVLTVELALLIRPVLLVVLALLVLLVLLVILVLLALLDHK